MISFSTTATVNCYDCHLVPAMALVFPRQELDMEQIHNTRTNLGDWFRPGRKSLYL